MKLPPTSGPLFRGKSRRFKWSTTIIVLIVVIVIAVVVPLAVVLPRKSAATKGLKSIVLVPLYIYPASGAWDPLYDVVTSNPEQHFTVILNPDSGPGGSPFPADQYMVQIQKINNFTNVQTVGYVRTKYATRNISEVLTDVAIYSGWNTHANATTGTKLAVHGIFFDEAPSEYSPRVAEYMSTINQAVKDDTGFLGNKIIIHNPGTIPDSRLVDPTTDFSVVFEGSYKDFNGQQILSTALPLNRTRSSFVIHSIPDDISAKDMKKFAAKASQHSELFSLIDVDVDFYSSFGRKWATYIDIMPS